MYIYNVTSNVQEQIHDKWIEWMKKEHIPAMLDTKKFTKALLTRVMVQEPMGGITYSVQYTVESKEMLQKYYDEDAEELRKKATIFGEKVVSFRTELEVVNEQ
ncbi:DUF4286 family protein [Autumnicola musiva]|uniref:DUF4286 family protein n=1 Tax=Autumnicola musiva TaxID=3075589 RepID=A0ABU3D861_9FLAO|nr:DUF4286 family protein [Zunongwangia sp. F117]MDT0677715.1 DUF4286 family protein [Zunongwangia sp. F117]